MHPLYTGQQLTLGFTQVDFNEEEGTGSVTVRVRKTGENAENLVVTVTPLTYDEFDSMGLAQPSEIQRASDPAECKYLDYLAVIISVVQVFYSCLHSNQFDRMYLHLKIQLGTCLWHIILSVVLVRFSAIF